MIIQPSLVSMAIVNTISSSLTLLLCLVDLRFPCIIDQARSFKGGGCPFPCEVRSMGTWNNLQEGFTVNERLPDTLVDVAVCNVYFSVANLHRQKK